jgi:hypothetical protein
MSSDMKRDMDLVRKILLAVEDDAHNEEMELFVIDGYDDETVTEHVRLLAGAGFVEAMNLGTMDGAEWRPTRLTWSGHDFLEAARNDSIWFKAKSKILEQGIGLSIEVLKAMLLSVAKEKLGMH